MKDPYFKLKPLPPTPEEEMCNCENLSEIYLAYKLGNNPLHCLECNGEIPPENLGFHEKFAEQIASWNTTFGSLYLLWLDSGEYEDWAKEKMLDANGQVNKDGLNIVQELSKLSKTYYLWFRESYEDPSPSKCPICNRELKTKNNCSFLFCEQCLILT